MASFGFYKTKNCWRVDFIGSNGKRSRRLFENKDVAKAFYIQRQYREECLNNAIEYIDDIDFSEASELFIRQYLATKSQNYLYTETNRIRGAISDTFGGRIVSQISTQDINRFILLRLEDQKSPKTILNDLSTLSTFFDWCKQSYFCSENPVAKANKPAQLPTYKARALTPHEVQELYKHSCHCCRHIIAILVNTGLRRSELKNLTTQSFDLRNGVLKLEHTKFSPQKGKRGRAIPINDVVHEIVSELPEGQIINISISTFADHFYSACERAKFKARIHDLRHTYITELVSSGLDLHRCMKITGHKNVTTLMNYVHEVGLDFDQIRNNVSFDLVTHRSQKDGIIRNIRHSEVQKENPDTPTFQMLKEYRGFADVSRAGFEPALLP